MTKTCTDCPANRISSDKPYGYCPLGSEQKRVGRVLMPKGECPAPRNHAELLEAMEDEQE